MVNYDVKGDLLILLQNILTLIDTIKRVPVNI